MHLRASRIAHYSDVDEEMKADMLEDNCLCTSREK